MSSGEAKYIHLTLVLRNGATLDEEEFAKFLNARDIKVAACTGLPAFEKALLEVCAPEELEDL